MNRSGDAGPAEPVADPVEPVADPTEPAAATAPSYELAPARISPRTSRPALAAAAAIVGLLAIAATVGVLDRGGAPGVGLLGRGDAPNLRRANEPPARPVTVRCHDLAAGPCNRVAAAALDVIGPDAAVESIDVWQSLLCGDDMDCPAGRLAGLRPLGSAVVGFGDAESAGWVNVGERPAAGAGGGGEPALVAWLIR